MTLTQRPIVLLARPHPMIVTEMRRFLEENDYEPLPLSELLEKPREDPRAITGGVISTSLTSKVREPVEEVARRLREWYPDLPLVFATIGERQVMARALARKLRSAIGTLGVLDALEVRESDERLGRPDHVLLLHRDDLVVSAGSSEIPLVVKRHLAGISARVARSPAMV